MSSSLFKRCSCSTVVADPDGQPKRRDLSSTCPKLRRPDGTWSAKHGSWFFHLEITQAGAEGRDRIRHGGYGSRREAEAALNAVAELVAIADRADDPAKARVVIADMIRGRFKTGEPLPDADQVRARTRIGQSLEVDVTVEQWLRRWLASKAELRPSTRISYAAIIDNYLVPALGEHRLDRLRPSHIREAMADIAERARQTGSENAARHAVLAASKKAWRDHDAAAARAARAKLAQMPPFRKPLGAATIQRIRAVLRSALTDAAYEQLITINPAKLVKLASGKSPKALMWTPGRVQAWRATGVKPGPVMVWTASQTATFLRRAARHRLYAMYLLIAHCGLRRGEACGLRWQDLDLENGTMSISQQIVQIGWATDVGDTGWFADLAREAGLPPIRLHDLRHGTATHLLTAGIEMKVVSEILGHSSTVITADLYTSVVDELKKAAADAIADVFTRPDGNRQD